MFITSWADSQQVLQETQNLWDIIVAIQFVECFTWLLFPGPTWILALVSVILYSELYPNLVMLLDYFVDGDNYDDKDKYKKVMEMRT